MTFQSFSYDKTLFRNAHFFKKLFQNLLTAFILLIAGIGEGGGIDRYSHITG